MKSLVFSLACISLVACGGPTKGTTEPQTDMASRSGEVESGAAPLQSIHEIRETDSGLKVGMVYQRDHGKGRSIYWVYDREGNRRGFITADNRAFAYEYVLGKRTDKTVSLGSDTISTSARKIIGSDRAIKLVEIDIGTWANSGK
jgi:hypothetical protein